MNKSSIILGLLLGALTQATVPEEVPPNSYMFYEGRIGLYLPTGEPYISPEGNFLEEAGRIISLPDGSLGCVEGYVPRGESDARAYVNPDPTVATRWDILLAKLPDYSDMRFEVIYDSGQEFHYLSHPELAKAADGCFFALSSFGKDIKITDSAELTMQELLLLALRKVLCQDERGVFPPYRRIEFEDSASGSVCIRIGNTMLEIETRCKDRRTGGQTDRRMRLIRNEYKDKCVYFGVRGEGHDLILDPKPEATSATDQAIEELSWVLANITTAIQHDDGLLRRGLRI